MLDINPEQVSAEIVDFLAQTFQKAGFSRAVIGLSGGVDSGLACHLTVKALGPENVYPLLLPYGALNSEAVLDGMSVVEWLKIPLAHVLRFDIKSTVDEILRTLKEISINDIRKGNLMARIRMSISFDQAKKLQALVVGTENKSEHLLGYYTRFGDEASDMEPLRHLYKTQVYALAKYAQLPEKIINKAPTAGLWPGQTDEAELGFTYVEADQILDGLFEAKLSDEELIKQGNSQDLINKVKTRVEKNQFKENLPYKIQA